MGSLERLVAQRTISHETASTSRPKLQTRNSSYFRNTSNRRLKNKASPSDRFSHEDAHFFQSLPKKIQKKQFTSEERQLLAGENHSQAPDPVNEVDCHSVPQPRRKHSDLVKRTSTSSSISSVHTLEERPIDSTAGMDKSVLDSFRWMEDEEDLDLTLDNYHEHLMESKLGSNPRQPSFRRTLSLTALPREDYGKPTPCELITRTTSSTPLPIPSRRDSYERLTSRSVSRLPRLPPTASQRPVDRSAKHYQDAETRLKLRVYLASPSKFDEALEFGFPSLTNTSSTSSNRPSLSRNRHTEPTPQTFLDDDLENSSFLDGLSDSDSLSEMETPHTPSDTYPFHNTHRLPTSQTTSSELERPLVYKTASAPKILNSSADRPWQQSSHMQLAELTGNREMTLRMTLTRPELRARESLLYAGSVSQGDDPLALGQLHTGVALGKDPWDHSRKEAGRVKRLWRRFRGRT